jgi:cellulase/cellobiase CelA1
MPKPKLISTPEDLMQLFNDYKKEVKSKPFIVTDWVGGMAKMVERKKEKPLTIEGFRNYCALLGKTITDYFSNKDTRYSEYATICRTITELIRQDQIEGGMAGIYNPSITQRLNNLVEKTQTEIVEQPLFPNE